MALRKASGFIERNSDIWKQELVGVKIMPPDLFIACGSGLRVLTRLSTEQREKGSYESKLQEKTYFCFNDCTTITNVCDRLANSRSWQCRCGFASLRRGLHLVSRWSRRKYVHGYYWFWVEHWIFAESIYVRCS